MLKETKNITPPNSILWIGSLDAEKPDPEDKVSESIIQKQPLLGRWDDCLLIAVQSDPDKKVKIDIVNEFSGNDGYKCIFQGELLLPDNVLSIFSAVDDETYLQVNVNQKNVEIKIFTDAPSDYPDCPDHVVLMVQFLSQG